jgi:hypothetical protein
MKRIFIAIALFALAQAATAYNITADTVWSGNHVATESVTVSLGATLRIDAGTTVQMPTGAWLRVEGRVLAEGTTTQPILFTRVGHRAGSNRWAKIRVSGATGESVFRHTEFWYGNGLTAGQGGRGVLSVSRSQVLVEDAAFYYHIEDCAYIETGSTATLRRVYFSTGGDERPGTGGGQGVTGYPGWIEIDSCVFAYREGRFDGSDIEGRAWVHNSIYLGSNLDDGCDFDNSNGLVENCLFVNYLGLDPGWETRCGGVTMNDAGGVRVVRNNIFINCRQGVISKGDTIPFITNCTFYKCFNAISAYEFGEPATHMVGYPTIRNCIMWDTTSQTIVIGNDDDGVRRSRVNIDYCLVSSTETLHYGDPRMTIGPHIFKADPLFANPSTSSTAADFHLKSQAGRWDPRANGGAGAWVIDAVHSPAIDAGDPGSTYTHFTIEPDPNGNRINLGAYGGTAQASKSVPMYRLDTDARPTTGGTVLKTPDRPSYFFRDEIRIEAQPAAGYLFDHWEGAATGTDNPTTVALEVIENRATAVFVPGPGPTAVKAWKWLKY